MKEFLKNIKKAWKYGKNQKKYIIGYIAFNVVFIFINLFVPILSAKIIVSLTSNQFEQVLFIGLVILIVEILRNTAYYATSYFRHRIFRETFNEIEISLGTEILKIENSCLDENGSGLFIQRLTNDASKVADIFVVLNVYLTNIVTNIGIFLAVFIISKIMFLYIVIMITTIFIVEKKRITIVNQKDKAYRKEHEKLSGFVGELVHGAHDIKMLNAEKSFIKELGKRITHLNQEKYNMNSINRNYQFITGTLRDLFDAGSIFTSILLIAQGNLSIANALVVNNYMGNLASIVFYISEFLEKVKDFNLSSERIFSIIDSKEFPKEKFGKKQLKKIHGDFEFKNVCFGYKPEQLTIKNMNFKIKANSTVAFVGKSGAGKSTVFSLLCKMYDINSGDITIDGISIKELDKDSIRGNITIISQNPYIFNMSIKENLRLVKENLTDEEMVEACKTACLDEFINSLPEGYDTMIGEGGINLSGGERQRLAIARALVQKTEIILFDEATSALDNETQSSIKQAIDNMKNEYTILIIAHRLSTVINSNKILLVEDGTIVDEGTHEELLKNSKTYHQLYDAELKKQNN
ncbi:MAG: ABC transporter ATP-binding protein/permease [Tenericutes bacterium]|nr:ABC transporter ATP-binding protein/permease [Mycoplasmatota bacterium]MDD6942277.1 ABC transporter ATP-binding protein [bacterium]MDY2697576.1 ABC transporter ATP-binding protein [Bacilli bacterium]